MAFDASTAVAPSSFESYLAASTQALFIALDERDSYTHQHCDRVSLLAHEIGIACGLSQKELDLLAVGARFHDIGKIGIPDNVLLKPGALTAEEWGIMKMHPVKGERLFRNTLHPQADQIATIIRHHHECFDGSGYPDGLAGDDIPLASRIMLIADAYDAMATTRPYHRARAHRDIIDILAAEEGIKTDPDVLARFLRVIPHSQARAD
ncbi:HD-GYP domain-containing protein [Methylobacillus flagellatus]|uniref:Metal dependent phosphohydrolase n=1 Tax=Methylobacillus flagellatus (strain ATCC 51484 / DSM 6875 / VKM B-1610 / KT) TaxID=265072 RepID=Q1H0J4_METFK|nr:HD domain-containing phosphohydrolase [Methylobacillus flagellatus]ABE49993.1 metal dependent phosphohydrolase [Methylobacillus flagellatus KT]